MEKEAILEYRKKYGLHIESFRQMVRNAKVEGYEAFKAGNPNKKYSAQIKKEAVEEFISGKASQVEICAKYGIRSRNTLQRWISCYNSGKNFKERTCSERGITMNKGRKTTQE